jgi:hypothetical protein
MRKLNAKPKTLNLSEKFWGPLSCLSGKNALSLIRCAKFRDMQAYYPAQPGLRDKLERAASSKIPGKLLCQICDDQVFDLGILHRISVGRFLFSRPAVSNDTYNQYFSAHPLQQ